MTGLSNNQFCIDQDTEIGSGIGATSLSNETRPRTGKYLSSSQNDVQHISILLKIGITVRNKLHHLHGNITHLTTLLDPPMTANGNLLMIAILLSLKLIFMLLYIAFLSLGNIKSKVNLTFSLSEIWTTGKYCTGIIFM